MGTFIITHNGTATLLGTVGWKIELKWISPMVPSPQRLSLEHIEYSDEEIAAGNHPHRPLFNRFVNYLLDSP